MGVELTDISRVSSRIYRVKMGEQLPEPNSKHFCEMLGSNNPWKTEQNSTEILPETLLRIQNFENRLSSIKNYVENTYKITTPLHFAPLSILQTPSIPKNIATTPLPKSDNFFNEQLEFLM